MRIKSLLLALSLVVAAGTSHASTSDFLIDGNLIEWSSTKPTFVLGPDSIVAGTLKSVPEDFQARIWLSLEEDGLYIAGTVTDQTYAPPTNAAEVLFSDHLELWLAFPPAQKPPINFGNQFRWDDINSAEVDCSEFGDPNNTCQEWKREQKTWRTHLERVFIRQYLISPLGVEEAYFSSVTSATLQKLPKDLVDIERGYLVAFPKTLDGYAFEAFVPRANLPASGQASLSSVQVMVDVVNNVSTGKGQERFYSSSKRRRFGQPETFSRLKLERPFSLEDHFNLLSEVLSKNQNFFVLPEQPVTKVFAFWNVAQGYQYEPTIESPRVLSMPFGVTLPTFKENVYVLLVPKSASSLGTERRLVSVVGERRHYYSFGERCADWFRPRDTYAFRRGNRTHYLFTCPGSVSRLGSGQGGATPEMFFELVELLPTGELKLLISENEDEMVSDEGINVSVSNDQLSFTFDWCTFDASDSKYNCFSKTYRWQPKRNNYIVEDSGSER